MYIKDHDKLTTYFVRTCFKKGLLSNDIGELRGRLTKLVSFRQNRNWNRNQFQHYPKKGICFGVSIYPKRPKNIHSCPCPCLCPRPCPFHKSVLIFSSGLFRNADFLFRFVSNGSETLKQTYLFYFREKDPNSTETDLVSVSKQKSAPVSVSISMSMSMPMSITLKCINLQFRFVSKRQFFCFGSFRNGSETPRQTDSFFSFAKKPETERVSVCFGPNRNKESFFTRTPQASINLQKCPSGQGKSTNNAFTSCKTVKGTVTPV